MKSISCWVNDIASGKATSTEAMQSVLDRVARYESQVKAFLSQIDPTCLLEQARTLDDLRDKTGQASHGLPIAIKDNISVTGQPLTAGSKMLEHFVSPYDATVVQKLRDHGFLFMGKTNLDEWAFGSSTEHSAYHLTHNPLDFDHVPGGSSGGSGAVMGYRGAFGALGSDTGGSIRLPASYCGIYALKPTYGRVSRFGLIAFGSSLDQIGPMGLSIDDVAYLLHVIEGNDSLDETSRSFDAVETVSSDAAIKIGVPAHMNNFLDGCDGPTREGYENFLNHMSKTQGVELVSVDLSPLMSGLPIYYVIAPCEASSNLSRFDGIRYGERLTDSTLTEVYSKTRALMGQEAKLRVLVGTFCLSAGHKEAFYQKASDLRNKLSGWIHDQFDVCDAIVIPTTPTVAFKLGERMDDPIAMYKSDAYTVAVNLTGVPALSCPHVPQSSKLPIGIQFIGAQGHDYRLCEIAKRFESFFVSPDPDKE